MPIVPVWKGLPNTQFTRFTSTKVQILTPEELRASTLPPMPAAGLCSECVWVCGGLGVRGQRCVSMCGWLVSAVAVWVARLCCAGGSFKCYHML